MNIMSVCSVSDYDITAISISEYELRQRPQKAYINQTRALLDDFYIGAIIPEFDTVRQLLDWRRHTIRNADYDHIEIGQLKRKPTGRKRKVSIDDFMKHYQRIINNEVTRKELAIELHISLNTVQLLIREIITGSR